MLLTHKQRIERILAGDEIDRPAISAWRHFYDRENSKDDLAEAMIAFQRKFGWDFMKINPRASYHIEGWGARIRYSTDSLTKPNAVSFPVSVKEDWKKIGPLDWRSGSLGEILAASRAIVEGIGSEVFCVQTVFSPLSIAADLVDGDDKFQILLRRGRDELHAALENITRTFAGFVSDLFKTGISGIFFATTEWASRNLLTEEEYLEFGKQYDLQLLAAAAPAVFNVIHVCNTNNMLPLFRDYPGQVLSWNPFETGNLSIHQAAQIFDKIFLTGIDQNSTLLAGSPGEISAQIQLSLQEAPPGRLILAPGCAVKVNTPDVNLQAAVDTAKRWNA
jgi:uroporphyrinogen decarboxylase